MVASVATSGFGTLLQRGDGGVGAGAQASVEWGTTNAKIRIKWGVAGTVGNGKNVTVVVSGSSYVYTILTANEISITVPTTATVAQVIANLYQQPVFAANWSADFGATPGDGSGTITARTVTATSGGTNGTEVFTTISEIKSISGPSLKQDLIEVTHMESPSSYREYIASLLDAGEVTFDLNFTNVAAQTAVITDLENRTRRNFKMLFTVSTGTATYTFTALVTNFEFNFGIEDAISASVTLKITGSVTRA